MKKKFRFIEKNSSLATFFLTTRYKLRPKHKKKCAFTVANQFKKLSLRIDKLIQIMCNFV